MLVLTRRIGESLMIGSRVTVTVVAVKGSQIRIGVDAPKSIPVHREELHIRLTLDAHLGDGWCKPLLEEGVENACGRDANPLFQRAQLESLSFVTRSA